MTVERIVLPGSTDPGTVRAVADRFGVPVDLGPLDEPWPGRWVSFARWAVSSGWPNLWRGERAGRQPTGPVRFSSLTVAIYGGGRTEWPPVFPPSRLREAAGSSELAPAWLTGPLAKAAGWFSGKWVIADRLAVGGVATTELELVARCGVTHVLDLRAEFDSTASAGTLGLGYLRLPVFDDGEPKPAEWFEAGVEFAETVLADPSARLMVLCVAGQSRSPAMVLAILQTWGGLGRSGAWLKLVGARPEAFFCPYRADVAAFLESRSGVVAS